MTERDARKDKLEETMSNMKAKLSEAADKFRAKAEEMGSKLSNRAEHFKEQAEAKKDQSDGVPTDSK